MDTLTRCDFCGKELKADVQRQNKKNIVPNQIFPINFPKKELDICKNFLKNNSNL